MEPSAESTAARVLRVLAALATAGALFFLLALRLVGMLSHQALAFVLLLGAAWVLPSRLWAWWRGELRPGLARADDGDRFWARVALVGRGGFWAVVVAAILLIFPRIPQFHGLIAGIAVVGLVRLAAEGLAVRRPNPSTSVVMGFGALILGFDLVRVLLPGAPAEIVLQPPFEGEWLVLQGGGSPLVSHHLSAYNQRYALDLMAVVDGAVLDETVQGNAMWLSWERPLFAPVDGTVVKVRDDMPDADGASLVTELTDAAGNHVVIQTADGLFVVLAHLRHGTVEVAEGDRVTAGQPLAKCGNSGNTTGSHLHLQVQTYADLWHPDNRSVPFAFSEGGRALARNARVGGPAD